MQAGLLVNDTNLLEQLRTLEIALHRSEVRSNRNQLDALLHDAFVEFGRSGQRYDKEEILMQLSRQSSLKSPQAGQNSSIWSQDYSLQKIAEGIVLLQYRSAHQNEDGQLTRCTRRSSLWQRTDRGWQMRFHQGTATDTFDIEPPGNHS